MNNNALTLIPARVRQIIYVSLSLVYLVITAVAAFFIASPYAAPWYVAAAGAGVVVLTAPFGFLLAATNVTPDTTTQAYVVHGDPDAEPKVLS